MTAADDNAAEALLAQYRTHICLVSDQAAANLWPVATCKPERLVLFVSKQMTEQADMLEAAVKTASPATRVEKITVEDPYNLYNNRDAFSELLLRCSDDAPVINVTGGTKPLAFAGLLAAFEMGIDAFYLNEADNSLLLLKAGATREERTAPIKLKIRTETYLAAYGCSVDDAVKNTRMNEKELELADCLVKQPSMRKVLPALNMYAASAEKKKPLAADTTDFQGDRAAFDTLCDYFDGTGHMRVTGKKLSFPSEPDRFFTAGGWLEQWVCHRLSNIVSPVYGNLRVKKGVRNEIDAAFMHNGRFYIVECKTSKLSDVSEANKVIYKLQTLRKLGGSKTRLVLVSYQPVHQEALKRAAESNITVIHDTMLGSFDDRIRSLLNQ